MSAEQIALLNTVIWSVDFKHWYGRQPTWQEFQTRLEAEKKLVEENLKKSARAG